MTSGPFEEIIFNQDYLKNADQKELETMFNFLSHTLSENVAEVIFVKVDGTERKFHQATKKSDLIPPYGLTHSTNKSTTKEFIPVYILEEKTWKSFKTRNIKSLKIVQ